ncbi:MAG: hypothetical protein WBA77_15890 [Microcoleaceae cyanobacterium]
MSKLKSASESRRTLAARVRSLTQLRILGPVGILTLLGIFVWQLSDHPEWFQVNDRTPNTPNTALSDQLSDEERSIAAEIDSSSLLLQELDSNASPINPLNDPILAGEDLLKAVQQSQNQSNASSTENLFLPEFSTSSSSDSTPPKYNFNFSQTQDNSITSPTFSPNFNSNSTVNSNPLNPQTASDANTDSTASTPLEAAMEQYNSNSSTINSEQSNSTQTSVLEERDTAQTETNSTETLSNNSNPSLLLDLGVNSQQTLPTQTNSNLPQPSWVVPRTPSQTTTSTPNIEPATIQNPYQTNLSIPRNLPLTQPTTPTTTPNYTNPYGQSPTPNSNLNYGYNNPGSVSNPNYGVIQPNIQNSIVSPNPLVPRTSTTLTPSAQPFSVPRPIPGRTIGGGRINTFANP